MLKILFVCHGNICRSPAAEVYMKEIVERAGLSAAFDVSSAATSSEELGNPVYPPMRRVLNAQGLDCAGIFAHRISESEYRDADLVIGMDDENIAVLSRRFGGGDKLRMLMSFAGKDGVEVSDPWYTGDFSGSFADIKEGCEGLLAAVTVIDFTECARKKDFFAVLRREMDWEDWYGDNLDALHDIVTGLPHRGTIFAVIPPRDETLVRYSELIEDILNDRV